MSLLSALEPPLCTLVFRVKRFKLVLLSGEFSSIELRRYLSTSLTEKPQKTEARIDYKWNSFKLQIYGISEHCQEDVPIENVHVRKGCCVYSQEMCYWGVPLYGGFYSVILCCNLKMVKANERSHIIQNIDNETR